MKLLRIVPDDTTFKFMRFRRMSFPFSAVLSIVSVLLFFLVGLNVGIDFTGGTSVEMRAKSGKADIALLRERAGAMNFGDVEIQQFGSAADVLVRVQLQPGGDAAQKPVTDALRSAFSSDYDFRLVESVGPRVSGELVANGILGVLLSVLIILAYLWFRFEWHFALGAVIATLHDLVLTVGFFAATQLEFNMTSIAAILTIVGYSVNDTVVVYDRIRELLRKYKRMPIHELLDLSMNSTLTRTVITSATTMLALIALAFFGGPVIRSFCVSLLFGVIIGTYSSIFIAAPVLIYLGAKIGTDAQQQTDAEAAVKAKA